MSEEDDSFLSSMLAKAKDYGEQTEAIASLHRQLHMGGVTKILSMPEREGAQAVQHLLHCHGHVFVIDNSHSTGAGDGSTTLGLSERSLECLKSRFPDWPWEA